MKIVFTLNDETTVTNDTVKLKLMLSGIAGDASRAELDKRCREAVEKVLPNQDWAFANFTYRDNGFTFNIQASTRISHAENAQLETKAEQASDSNIKVTIAKIDPSIPMHKMRDAEAELRQKIITLAREQAKALAGSVSKIDFTENYQTSVSNATYAKAFASDAAAGSAPIGHSEKISLSANVVVKTSDGPQQLHEAL